jgi:hypothetical protein
MMGRPSEAHGILTDPFLDLLSLRRLAGDIWHRGYRALFVPVAIAPFATAARVSRRLL